MFTREQLALNFCSPGEPEEMPLMEIVNFNSHRFHGRSDVGDFVALCGYKTDFSSSLQFWLWSFQYFTGKSLGTHLYRLIEEDLLCEPLTHEEYFTRIEGLIMNLKRLPDFLHRKNFLAAMDVFSGMNMGGYRSSWLAEFDDAFIAFHNHSED